MFLGFEKRGTDGGTELWVDDELNRHRVLENVEIWTSEHSESEPIFASSNVIAVGPEITSYSSLSAVRAR